MKGKKDTTRLLIYMMGAVLLAFAMGWIVPSSLFGGNGDKDDFTDDDVIVVECKEDADCSNEYCVDNDCVECKEDSHCLSDEECLSNICKKTDEPGCESNADCTSSKPYCSNEYCFECLLDSHCVSGEECKNKVCKEKENGASKFEKCEAVSDCSGTGDYVPANYYNRDCDGEWRCMDYQPAVKLCDYGCFGSEYCGDGICGAWETSWDCIDCNPEVGFIGEISIG